MKDKTVYCRRAICSFIVTLAMGVTLLFADSNAKAVSPQAPDLQPAVAVAFR